MTKKILICISFSLYFISFVVGCFSNHLVVISSHNYSVINQLRQPSLSHVLTQNTYVWLVMLCGSFTFGASTLASILTNGFTLGFLSKLILLDREFIWFVLPHGIFEIPAIIIAGAAGFKIPYEIIRYLAGKKEKILTREDIKEYLTLALISIILIVIAAWIEANVTLKIAKAMLNSTSR